MKWLGEKSRGSATSAFAAVQSTLRSVGSTRRVGKHLRWPKVLLSCVVLALLGTNALTIWLARLHAIEQAELANTNLARAVSDRVSGSLSQIDQLLQSIVFEIERSQAPSSFIDSLQPALVNQVTTIPHLDALFVIGPDGTWRSTSEPHTVPIRNSSDRAYFVHHDASRARGAFIGDPIVTRSSGEWVIPLTRRIDDPQGNFAGVMLATVSIAEMQAMLEMFDVGEGAISLSIHGKIFARRPYPAGGLDASPQTGAVVDSIHAQREGTGRAASPIDGVERMFSYYRIKRYPVTVLVASGVDEVLRSWRLSSTIQTIWTLLLCVMLLAAAIQVRRTIERRLKTEATLRQARDELSAANVHLAHLAQFDALTGLANRRYFDRKLERAARTASRNCESLAIVMIDVDHFKRFNDTYGHPAGDACLKAVGEALKEALSRSSDFVARYGGEEFAMILPGTTEDGARRVGIRALATVNALQMEHASAPSGKVSISLGIAADVPNTAQACAGLVARADAALYEAKVKGRGRVHAAGDHTS